MKKLKDVKIRREWTRHPATRVKEDKEREDFNPCEGCTEPCDYCCYFEDNRAGGA